jgi:hypothetical protein
MRTLTTNFSTEKNKAKGSQPRTLLEIDSSSGTQYLSDQRVSVSGQAYKPQVKTFGKIQHNISFDDGSVRTSEMSLELVNDTLLHAEIQPGDEVRLYVYYVGLITADKLNIFTGTITDNITGSWYTVKFSNIDISAWNNKLIGTILNIGSFPDADPDDIGNMIPIGYGVIPNHRCLISAIGGVTTLNLDVSDSYTGSFDVVDVSRFPNSGTFAIGEEEISYTSRDTANNQLEGTITRGVSGTTAASHYKGDAVIEKTTMKAKAFNHEAKALSNTRVIPFGHSIKDAVYIHDLISSTSLANAELTFNNPIAVAQRVAIAVAQQPSALDDSASGHDHTIDGASQATIFGIGVNSSNNATNTGNAFDQNEGTFCTLEDNTGVRAAHIGLDFNYSGSLLDGLTIVEAVAAVRHAAGATMDTYRLKLESLNPDYTQALDQSDTNVKTQKFIVAALAGETDWSQLDGLKVDCIDGDSIVQSFVYELWWEIKYTPNIDNTKVNVSTVDADNVQLSGGSVSAFIGGDIIVDAQGQPDDGSGTYTGTPALLIERPGHIIHHILINYANDVVAADIDLSGSFAETESNLPAAYEFGFAINNQIELINLLNRLAWQCWCRVFTSAGVWKLMEIKTSGTADKSINTKRDSITIKNRLALTYSKTSLNSLINKIDLRYNLDYVLGGWGNPDAYQASSEDSDSTSITAYKTRDKILLAFAIGDNSTMANNLRARFLTRFKDPRFLYSFPTTLKHVDLEIGDLISLTCEQLELTDVLCEILADEYSPPIPNKGKSPIINITALDIS